MQDATIQIKGVEKLLNKLERISDVVPTEVYQGMYKLTSRAAEKTRSRFPGWIWDTGTLAGSIDNLVRWERGHIAGYVFTVIKYGIYVHFGTTRKKTTGKRKKKTKIVRKMKARPFMNIAMRILSDPRKHRWAFGKLLK